MHNQAQQPSKESIPPAFVTRARTCKPFKEPRNRFPSWRSGTTTLFVGPARQTTKAGGIDFSESIPGLHKRLQIRALGRTGIRQIGVEPALHKLYIGWPNRFLRIDSWAPQKFTNSGYGTHFIFFILFCSSFPVSYCRSVLIISNSVIPPNYHIFPPDFPRERRVSGKLFFF